MLHETNYLAIMWQNYVLSTSVALKVIILKGILRR